MEMAPSASANIHMFSAPPTGYQALGATGTVEQESAKVRLRVDAATIEITALAPDLFRVGFFPQNRLIDYHSEAVVAQDWSETAVSIQTGSDAVTMTTPVATAHISLDPVRIGFTDAAGRAFACDDPVFGMGHFPSEQQVPPLDIMNAIEVVGAPVRVYKQHIAGEHYFACGERTGGLDKTGTHQIFWNIDPPPGHTALLNNLYVSIPFTLVMANGLAWGLFLDSTTRVEFDLAREDTQRSWFGASNGSLVYYVFCGPTFQDVLARYTELTGRTPLPPLWSLGNGQSRFSYETAEEVRKIARTFRERDIPCDTLYLDIDVLEGYRVFTWNQANFPDPAGLLAELREMGFHAVAIVDAGVKVEEGYAVYDDGKRRDLYCKNPGGTEYHNAVWPGVCAFPDFTNPAARFWWGEQHRTLLDAGISGIWSDMNEPGLFLPLNSTMPPDVVHPGDGHARLHLQVHNAYGSLMVQAAREGLLRLRPEQRPFIISRSGYAGVQRHALIWTGDNSSTWEHLAMSLPQLLNLGLSGVAWSGVDIGGFYGDSNGELLARWTELAIVYPFCRNHAEKQTRHQEPWVFGEPYETVCRAMLKLRQSLLPYLYTLFEECHRTGVPILRPLFWANPEDTTTYGIDDELLCGDALLIAPILHASTEYRHVYIPAGTWFHYWSGQRIDGPAHILAYAPLGQPPLYVRANVAIPFWPVMDYVGQRSVDSLTFVLYPFAGSGQATLYEDEGNGYAYLDAVYARRVVRCVVDEGMIQVTISEREGIFVPARQHIRLELREILVEPETVLLGEMHATWQYDREQQLLLIDLDETAQAQAIALSIRF